MSLQKITIPSAASVLQVTQEHRQFLDVIVGEIIKCIVDNIYAAAKEGKFSIEYMVPLFIPDQPAYDITEVVLCLTQLLQAQKYTVCCTGLNFLTVSWSPPKATPPAGQAGKPPKRSADPAGASTAHARGGAPPIRIRTSRGRGSHHNTSTSRGPTPR